MTTSTTEFETRRQALSRLLQIARESGVGLLRDDLGEMWATSVSDPGWLHKVEPDSCSCRGFAMHRRCRHVAALHAHLGYLDPDPTPPAATSPIPAPCGECRGVGTIASPRSRWVGGGKLGYRSEWTVQVACPACHPADLAA
jgi:hypothetical protein